ncbi:tRNA (uracil-5-)-methyltransferase trm9 protein [Venturia nashicola]|uniref:tRNA (Uracil-5-)-methyltransferase trm9 protein n=1 Tax=Venturia nashicola TaxID=86259 RepID=A0A4Z1PBK3_9PEZI|nr:tRNA (uracil-5-)-methyltransferase trm9 protein [Venturia nashicola]TLD31721.1 tRNA (uracil-5-)-methyltransferase trm9 protein [Venturia nashicola]
MEDRGENYEEEHVHSVYEEIAPHFSSTRYKPWPLIERFLGHLSPGSVGLDIGCGNGKYLAVNKNIFIVASDRSTNLVQIASTHQSHSAVVADILHLPHKNDAFDFAISIAVIHHLSTPERRIEAVATILELLKPPATNKGTGGKVLLYVWALEQSSSRRGWDVGHEQDVMVPWVLKQKGRREETFQRYYHLYKNGELEEDVVKAGGVVLESGYEKDNWWCIAGRNPLSSGG